jgi:hypothetical protein
MNNSDEIFIAPRSNLSNWRAGIPVRWNARLERRLAATQLLENH